jgi:chromosome segregation ATPase
VGCGTLNTAQIWASSDENFELTSSISNDFGESLGNIFMLGKLDKHCLSDESQKLVALKTELDDYKESNHKLQMMLESTEAERADMEWNYEKILKEMNWNNEAKEEFDNMVADEKLLQSLPVISREQFDKLQIECDKWKTAFESKDDELKKEREITSNLSKDLENSVLNASNLESLMSKLQKLRENVNFELEQRKTAQENLEKVVAAQHDDVESALKENTELKEIIEANALEIAALRWVVTCLFRSVRFYITSTILINFVEMKGPRFTFSMNCLFV